MMTQSTIEISGDSSERPQLERIASWNAKRLKSIAEVEVVSEFFGAGACLLPASLSST
jgi:hypothetical protein